MQQVQGGELPVMPKPFRDEVETREVQEGGLSFMLKPFHSKITGDMVHWQTDADVGLVLERRKIVTAVGSGRKEVVSVRKVWPWSPAFSSGAVVVSDILMSIDGHDVDEMDLSEIRAMLRGEEGSTVTLAILHLAPSTGAASNTHDTVLQQFVELERSVDYLRRDPRPQHARETWPDPRRYQDRVFYCMSLDSRLRRGCIALIESKAFQVMQLLADGDIC
jgi:hypothetical protein